jgi:hypothetical protein
MKKLPVSKIPTEFKKWSDDFDDYWLHRFIRSHGYTLDEIVELAKKNLKVQSALIFAIDAFFEKTIYRVIQGKIKTELAAHVFNEYARRFKDIKPGKIIEIDLGGENFYSGSYMKKDSE